MYRTAFLLLFMCASAYQPLGPPAQVVLLQHLQRGQMHNAVVKSTNKSHAGVVVRRSEPEPEKIRRPTFRVGGRQHTEYHDVAWNRDVHVWPEALVASRCDDDDICEACGNEPGSDEPDCWQGAPENALNIFVHNSQWTKHLAKITLQCAGDVAAYLKVHSIVQGNLSVSVNNEEIWTAKSWVEGDSKTKLDMPSKSHNEMYEVELKYEPSKWNSGTKPDILLMLRFVMDSDFVVCEESKLCLKWMMPDGVNPTKGSMLLRSSQQHQLDCLTDGTLEGDTLQEACGSWRNCLNSSDTLAEMTAMLGASVDTVPLPAKSKNQALLSLLSTQCKTPTDLDPEAWDCNCHESMKVKCAEVQATEGYTDTLCFQALLCNHDDICAEWKNRNCKDNVDDVAGWGSLTGSAQEFAKETLGKVKQLQEALLSSSLLQTRRLAHSGEAHIAEHLDDSLGDKSCFH